ncbi:MAG: hypothetical protein CMH50_00105 [Myxococcales bacterium]|nr:hypothetical protein [Myxococcales bacterium]
MEVSMHRCHLSFVIVLLALAGGCAEALEPVSRLQPNRLKKSDLDGYWLYGRTVVDVPASDGFTFVGDGSWELQKVRFDIQERYLYVRRQTEYIKDGDDLSQYGASYEGELVGAFAIQKHFDISQPYNPATGETYNIVDENSIDRPWHERTYMRVDWSKNLVVMADQSFDREASEPVSYFVQTEGHVDAPNFDYDDDGDSESLDYFDVTTRMFAKAGMRDYGSWGRVPLCWFFDTQFAECGPGMYTIRNSFMKVPVNNPYEPVPYKGKETDHFGYFWTERFTYDGQEGIRQQNRERWRNRHNIWEKTVVDDESAENFGDPLPMEARTGKPIVYHVNPKFPPDAAACDAKPEAEQAECRTRIDGVLHDVIRDVEADYDEVFSGLVEELGATMPPGGKMFVVCPHNPIIEGDPEVCGQVGDTPRLGDIRYSFIAYIADYMTYGLLGLGPSHTDPETGQTHSGMGYVYHHNDTAAWDVTQMILLLNDQLDNRRFIDGLDLTDWRESFSRGRQGKDFSLADAKHMLEKMTKDSPAARYWEGRQRKPGAEDVAFQNDHGFKAWLAEEVLPNAHRHGMIEPQDGRAQARLQSLRGSQVEGLLMTPDMQFAMGIDPNMSLDEDQAEVLSPLTEAFRNDVTLKQKLFEEDAARRNMYLASMADDALLGLAREYAGRNLSPSEIYDAVRYRIYRAVVAHEVGHSIGLMHNFGASDDALNYHNEYWELRTADGTVGPRVGENADPITEDEIDGNLYNYGYTSVMDYAGRYTIDGTGLGKYDKAAIYWGYGGLVEVFEDHHGVEDYVLEDWAADDGEVMRWGEVPTAFHYTRWYDLMGDDLWRDDNRSWARVADMDEDYVEAVAGPHNGKKRVPYVYCSHNRYNLGDSCLTRDWGADPAERIMGLLDTYDTWYITRAFPRGKVSSSYYWWNYVPRNYSRIYDRLKSWHDVYGLYQNIMQRYYTGEELEAFFSNTTNGWGTQTYAVQAAFNHLVRTMLMPDVTDYGPETDFEGKSMLKEWPYVSGAEVDLGVADARYYSTRWSYGYNGQRDCGYFWSDCLHHIGFYLDKIMAVHALTDTETNFVGRATPEDVREWQVGYFNSFGDQIKTISQALMSGDMSRVGPYLEDGELKFPNYTGALETVHDQVVDPYATFTIQLYWQVLGMARFQTGYDPSFTETNSIWVVGADDPVLNDAQRFSFEDPDSGMTYMALDGGAAAALLAKAQRMYERSTHCLAACVEDCENQCPEPHGDFTRDAVDVELTKHMQLVKAVSVVTHEMDFGDPYSP